MFFHAYLNTRCPHTILWSTKAPNKLVGLGVPELWSSTSTNSASTPKRCHFSSPCLFTYIFHAQQTWAILISLFHKIRPDTSLLPQTTKTTDYKQNSTSLGWHHLCDNTQISTSNIFHYTSYSSTPCNSPSNLQRGVQQSPLDIKTPDTSPQRRNELPPALSTCTMKSVKSVAHS